jgi:uncharacterized protein (TIGR02453 family)
MANRAHFSPALFSFLRSLAKNNNREWFQEHKERYEADVRDPLLRFIGDFGPRLRSISKSYVADPRPTGGSMLRIYRDTRFSKDKTPYKTAAGAHFQHEDRGEQSAPGFYLHLEPGQVFAGMGIWHPDAPSLQKIRDAIAAPRSSWRQAAADRDFAARCKMGGESLQRPPKGYDPEHPSIEDLKRKDFVASTDFTEKDACAPDFLDRFTEACAASAPFMKFLTKAVGLQW